MATRHFYRILVVQAALFATLSTCFSTFDVQGKYYIEVPAPNNGIGTGSCRTDLVLVGSGSFTMNTQCSYQTSLGPITYNTYESGSYDVNGNTLTTQVTDWEPKQLQEVHYDNGQPSYTYTDTVKPSGDVVQINSVNQQGLQLTSLSTGEVQNWIRDGAIGDVGITTPGTTGAGNGGTGAGNEGSVTGAPGATTVGGLGTMTAPTTSGNSGSQVASSSFRPRCFFVYGMAIVFCGIAVSMALSM